MRSSIAGKGVFIKQNDGNLLEPVLEVFYHAGYQHYIAPTVVNIAKLQDRIASFENYEKWKIAPYHSPSA